MSDTFCPNCGAKIDLSLSDTCPNCGEKISVISGSTDVATDDSGEFRFAGFWIRFVAYIIDGIILFVAFVILFAIFGDIGGVILAVLATWLYFAYLESSDKQATLGKQAVGVIVMDTDGQRISFARATGRWLAKILSALILYLGYIMIGFTEHKQGLHDMIVNTYVCYKN